MGITYKIDAEARVIYAIASGDIGTKDIDDLRKRISADPSYDPGFDELFDARNARTSISGEEMFGMALLHREQPLVRKLAIVASEVFGFARMYQGGRGDDAKVMVFEDMAPAREWLGLPPEEE